MLVRNLCRKLMGIEILWYTLFSADFHDVAGFLHYPVDRLEKQLVQLAFLQQMSEFAQRCLVRHILFHKVDAREFPHGIAIIDCVLCRRVGRIEPNLEQIHSLY